MTTQRRATLPPEPAQIEPAQIQPAQIQPAQIQPADPASVRAGAEGRRESEAPDFDRVVRALARWYLEVRSGRRSADQLQELLTSGVRHRLRTRAADPIRCPEPEPVLRALVQRPGPGRVESVVLAERGGRVVAISIALSWHRERQRWLVTELTVPEELAVHPVE